MIILNPANESHHPYLFRLLSMMANRNPMSAEGSILEARNCYDFNRHTVQVVLANTLYQIPANPKRSTLLRFAVIEPGPLGRGSFGEVSRVKGIIQFDPAVPESFEFKTTRHFVLKQSQLGQTTKEADRTKSYYREEVYFSRLSPKLKAKYSVRYNTKKNEIWFLMREQKGQAMSHMIKELRQDPRRLSGERRLRMSIACLEALQSQVHGIEMPDIGHLIHRDIKPGNIIVGPDDSIHIIDFNGAIHAAHAFQASYFGTAGYVDPEIWRDKWLRTLYPDRPYKVAPSAATDIFAMAMTLRELWACDRDPNLEDPFAIARRNRDIPLDGFATGVTDLSRCQLGQIRLILYRMTRFASADRLSLQAALAAFKAIEAQLHRKQKQAIDQLYATPLPDANQIVGWLYTDQAKYLLNQYPMDIQTLAPLVISHLALLPAQNLQVLKKRGFDFAKLELEQVLNCRDLTADHLQVLLALGMTVTGRHLLRWYETPPEQNDSASRQRWLAIARILVKHLPNPAETPIPPGCQSPEIECCINWFLFDQSWTVKEADYLVAEHLRVIEKRQALYRAFNSLALTYQQGLVDYLRRKFNTLQEVPEVLLFGDESTEYYGKILDWLKEMERASCLVHAHPDSGLTEARREATKCLSQSISHNSSQLTADQFTTRSLDEATRNLKQQNDVLTFRDTLYAKNCAFFARLKEEILPKLKAVPEWVEILAVCRPNLDTMAEEAKQYFCSNDYSQPQFGYLHLEIIHSLWIESQKQGQQSFLALRLKDELDRIKNLDPAQRFLEMMVIYGDWQFCQHVDHLYQQYQNQALHPLIMAAADGLRLTWPAGQGEQFLMAINRRAQPEILQSLDRCLRSLSEAMTDLPRKYQQRINQDLLMAVIQFLTGRQTGKAMQDLIDRKRKEALLERIERHKTSRGLGLFQPVDLLPFPGDFSEPLSVRQADRRSP